MQVKYVLSKWLLVFAHSSPTEVRLHKWLHARAYSCKRTCTYTIWLPIINWKRVRLAEQSNIAWIQPIWSIMVFAAIKSARRRWPCKGGLCRRTVFTEVLLIFFLPLLYVCLMVYGRFHGNNDTLRCLLGLTHGQEAEGNQSSGDHFWPWVAFYFISALQEASAVLKWLLWPPRHQTQRGPACSLSVFFLLF